MIEIQRSRTLTLEAECGRRGRLKIERHRPLTFVCLVTYGGGHSIALHEICIRNWFITTTIGVVDNAVERLIDELPEDDRRYRLVELKRTTESGLTVNSSQSHIYC